MQIISLSNDFGVDCNFFYSEVVKRSLGGIFLQFLVHCWLRRDESGSRNQPKNGFKRQVEQGFSSFPPSQIISIFDDFSKWSAPKRRP